MTNLPQGQGGWLRRRSVALSEIARFARWSITRLAHPARLLTTLALFLAIAAAPWVVDRIGWLAWLMAGGAVGALVLIFILLLISYLRVYLQTETARAHLQTETLEQRLESLINTEVQAARADSAKQIRGAMALNADKLEVLRTEFESKVVGAFAAQEALTGTVVRLEQSVREGAADLYRLNEGLDAFRTEAAGSIAAVSAHILDVEKSVAESAEESHRLAEGLGQIDVLSERLDGHASQALVRENTLRAEFAAQFEESEQKIVRLLREQAAEAEASEAGRAAALSARIGDVEHHLTVQLNDARQQGEENIRGLVHEAVLGARIDDLEHRLTVRLDDARLQGDEKLRSLLEDMRAEVSERIRALLDDIRMQDGGDLQQAIEELRLESAEQMRAVAALTIDRIEVARADLERRGAVNEQEREAAQAALAELDRQIRQATERLSLVESGVSALRSDVVKQGVTVTETIEARVASERPLIQDALAALRAEIERLLEAKEQQTREAIDYLRTLLDRRVQAGAAVVRGEIESFRGEIQASVSALQEAQVSQDVLQEVSALQVQLDELSELRTQVGEALISQSEAVRHLQEQQEAGVGEIEGLRVSVSEALQREASERASAIQAVAEAADEKYASLQEVVETGYPTLEARIAELRTLLEARMGPEFEARLEAWRARLDNEIGAALHQGRMEDSLANQEREARLRSELQSLHDAILRQQADSKSLQEAVASSMEAVRSDLSGKLDAESADSLANAAREAIEALRAETRQQLEERDARAIDQAERMARDLASAQGAAAVDIESIADRVGAKVAQGALEQIDALKAQTAQQQTAILEQAERVAAERLAASLKQVSEHSASKDDVKAALAVADQALQAATAAGRTASAAAESASSVGSEDLSRIEKGIKDVEARAASSAQAMRRLSDANAAIARPFDRLLANDKIQRIEQHWLKAFGINMTRTALAYMAHKICLLEDRGMGRIAAPIETIVMRQLALRSLPNRGKLEVMEIGTLFGLGAAVLYNFRGQRASGMHLTLVDPLEGYYEAGGADPVTGVEVSEAILRRNLADLDVPESDYRLIKALSSDPQAIRPASDRLYDLILVDGDHSTAGVAADFENYGPLVKPGGLMIFDDYGSEHWPGIQPYVDETVRTDPNWIWIGADYRTAILAKKADGATAKVSAAATKAPATPRRAPKR